MKKPNLREIQELLQSVVKSADCPLEIGTVVMEKPPVDISTRLKIYQQGYSQRLLGSLKEDFSRVEERLTSLEFDELLKEFVVKTPSTVRNLAEYSKNFPIFLKSKDYDLYLLSLKDWLEVLDREQKRDSFNPQETSGIFLIKAGLGVVESMENEKILFYPKEETVLTLKLNPQEEQLLEFFKLGKNLEELENFNTTLGLKEDVLTSIVFNWIKEGIIYCEKENVC